MAAVAGTHGTNGTNGYTGEGFLARFPPGAFEKLSSDDLLAIRLQLSAVLDNRARKFDVVAEIPVAPDPELTGASNSHLATVLSPSQVRTFVDCQARWYFKYSVGLPDPKNSRLALGIAVHEALRANFEEKLEAKEDLAIAGVVAVFRDAWAEQAATAVFQEVEDPNDFRDLGEVLVEKYMAEAAPRIKPAAVELPVRGEIGGVQVQGKVDLVDTAGTVIDVKTAAKKPNGFSPDYVFQLATYRQIVPGASGRGRIDTLTKTKTVQLVQQSFEVSEADVRVTANLYPLAQEGMRSGLYMPNRGSNLCSRHNCPFWAACEREFGGEVKA
jgi:RecB family exonuclease